MHKCVNILAFLLISILGYCQEIESKVINSSGNTIQNPDYTLIYSVGNIVGDSKSQLLIGFLSYNNELTATHDLILQNIKIYPIPSNDYFVISGSDITKIEIKSINDSYIEKQINLNNNHFDITHLPTGFYYISVFNKHSFTIKKLIKN